MLDPEQELVNDLLDISGLTPRFDLEAEPVEGVVQVEQPVEVPLSVGERAIQWIENEFYIPEIRAPMPLYPYQKAALREAYRTDENGKFIYSLIIWGDIKKSAKSCIAAATALERARRTEWGSVRIAANSRDQADSRVAFYLRRAVMLNPKLNQTVRTKNYTIMMPNHCIIQSIPLNPKTVAGGNDDLISFSELWAADNDIAQQCWTELTLSPTKFGESQRWVDTYAGYHDKSLLLERLYNQGKEGYLVETEIPGLELYANPETQMLMLWNTVPRLPWQTGEVGRKYYAQEASTLTPSEFDRVHRNQWVSSVGEFIQAAWWEQCKGLLPELGKYDGLAVACDAGVKSDCFAIVAVSKHGKLIVPRLVKVWYPPKHGKIIFRNRTNPDDPEYPEGFLRKIIQEYNVIVIGYDPYQLHSLISDLDDEGLGWFREFGQVKERLEADKQLYDYIVERRILNPDNSDLTSHLMNADAETQADKSMRIVKRSENSKVDAAVCLSMATFLAEKYIPD